jgi:5-carboxymethyl-2-hydroxymuconate isomerase
MKLFDLYGYIIIVRLIMETYTTKTIVRDTVPESTELPTTKFKIDVGRLSEAMREKCALLEDKLKEIKSPESIEKMLKISKLKDISEKQHEMENQQHMGYLIPHPPPHPPPPPSYYPVNTTTDQSVVHLTKTILDTFNGLSTKITDLDRTLKTEQTIVHRQMNSKEINQMSEEINTLKNDITDIRSNLIELSTKVDLLSTSTMMQHQMSVKKHIHHRMKHHKDVSKLNLATNTQKNKQSLCKHHLNTILFV